MNIKSLCYPKSLLVEKAKHEPVGTRYPCEVCHAEWILGPGVSGLGRRMVHAVFKYHEFDHKKTNGQWMVGVERGKKLIYLRCQSCGWILKTDIRDVDELGYVVPKSYSEYMLPYHCLICAHCKVVVFAFLEEWTEIRKKSGSPENKNT